MLLWYVAGVSVAIAVSWLAALLHVSGYAPLGIVSLGVGCVLGAAFGGTSTTLRVAGRRELVIGTILLSILTVLAEHAWLYRDFRRQWHAARANSAEVALFRPESPWSPAEYLAREASAERVALWVVDAALIAAAAMGTAVAITGRDAGNPPATSDAAKSSAKP
jgi:hypothetical protein